MSPGSRNEPGQGCLCACPSRACSAPEAGRVPAPCRHCSSGSSARVWALGVAELPVGPCTRCSMQPVYGVFVLLPGQAGTRLLSKSARCHEVM